MLAERKTGRHDFFEIFPPVWMRHDEILLIKIPSPATFIAKCMQ
jgi:hypothetical protein